MDANSSAVQRIQNELRDIYDDPLAFASVGIEGNDYFKMRGTLNGPPGTPFEGGLFEFTIDFDTSYPLTPPTFIFKTPIFHPNVAPPNFGGWKAGQVCLPIFQDKWSCDFTLKTIISYIIALLNNPNPAKGFPGFEATRVMSSDMDRWKQMAREHTLRNAMG